eukprot:CAMPEP_0183711662 /NCGR_PEP_ID=MMETSP0737-20130205/7121_1 /TAXON_ID=385413 /ORGANISM="Thalassiosira miniscula, Strain CCMP1093" /LENGTH=416 /DNA_ID=CAMNT_0025940229 /DNA_START=92 /DNA_END=1342 /DNA_ORIENTATION=-
MTSVLRPKWSHLLILAVCTARVPAAAALSLSVGAPSSPSTFGLLGQRGASRGGGSFVQKRYATASFHYGSGSGSFAKHSLLQSKQQIRLHRDDTALFNSNNNDDSTQTSSFLSTNKASVSFQSSSSNTGSNNAPANLSPIDQFLLTVTSDQTSLLLGSVGILVLLLNRLISFPEDAIYEASRSRIDLLGVFAAGSVLLNGITKLDVESVVAERVILDGINEDTVVWNNKDIMGRTKNEEKFRTTAEWALASFLKCTPARTAVLLGTNPQKNQPWIPLASRGVLPSDTQLRSMIPLEQNTPILDRMLRFDGSIKGGTVGGTGGGTSSSAKKGPNESYLPTLQALPGKVEFTYLPSNAQEALLLPVVAQPSVGSSSSGGGEAGWYYAVVLGGDTAKSFAPRDIAWCKEIASWIGDELV